MIRPLSALLGIALVTSVAFAWFTHPLPQHLTSAIPELSHGGASDAVRTMVVGDHLQLNYWYAMVHDFLTTDTPWFHNLWEFNVEGDHTRRTTRAFFLPVSLIYSLGTALNGPAFGYNLSIWVAVALAFGLTGTLCTRVCGHPVAGWSAALLTVVFPYQWVTLLHGSPTGFVMWVVPAAWLGIDLALRDGRMAGGWLAGFAYLSAIACDLHVFYFSALLAPVFVLISLLLRGTPIQLRTDVRLWIRSLSGLMVCGVGVVAYTLVKQRALAGTEMSAPRGLRELHLYSPFWREVLFNNEHPYYVGWPLLVLCVLAMIGMGIAWRRGAVKLNLLLVALTSLTVVLGLVMIAWGLRGPSDIKLLEPIRLCRELIPGFTKIRQPAKALLCLAPFAAVLLALATRVLTRDNRPRLAWVLPGLLLVLGQHFSSGFHPVLCTLDLEHPAYEEATQVLEKHYAGRPDKGRALSIPLWPGDSSWNAFDQHFAVRHHLRMINGYSPAVPAGYRAAVFDRFHQLNMGWAPDPVLDGLRDLRAPVLLFHEHAYYPQKWSAHPPAYTLETFRQHPRLRPVTHARGTWLFEILPPADTQDPPPFSDSRPWLGNRWRDGARGRLLSGARLCPGSPPLTRPQLARLDQPQASWVFPWTEVSPVGEAVWMVRARGEGAMQLKHQRRDAGDATPLTVELTGDQWRWLEVPATEVIPSKIGLTIQLQHGYAEIDQAFWTAAPVPRPAIGSSFEWPATHALYEGWTEDGGVHLDTDRTRRGRAWWLPWWPLDPGTYRVTLDAETEAGAATLYVSLNGQHVMKTVDASLESGLTFTLEQSSAVEFAVDFKGVGPVLLKHLRVERMPLP